MAKDANDSSKVTLRDVFDSVNGLREEISVAYVRKEEFAPVKALVYGLTALILSGVFIALLALVVKGGK